MLGIMVGVAAVIAIISIAAGSRAQVTSSISEMGSNLITISPGFRRGGLANLAPVLRIFLPWNWQRL